ncbi:lycopene cyclase family protein [Pseudobacter ginsenosidimutans]|uniref:Lycopene beta-cyclase n=1 Tax=Pseudobacter ginsenosidimutans TaxID=661488 RepID=A0A4Q7MYK4_9BACT|nr:lycopene cyclase family protein [Pseudobacter ginsenosidimutans]QEC41020.1 lycopene cyclase [Pseudobacter ginsenosidimutans]RZS72230.1 lycopene beta-cyclase [Pseudobacter ginsenosidimutans]
MIRNEPGNKRRYDYIFTGAGCAAMSLLMRLLKHPSTSNKRILLVDKDNSGMYNKTWCFWEKGTGFFESIVHHQYDQLWYYGNEYSKCSNIFPYHYKMIRGEDFYHHCMKEIARYPNVEWLREEVSAIDGEGEEATAQINGQIFSASYIFNSIIFRPPVLKKNEHMLLQHFKGWFIETEEPVFDPAAATLMDFRVSQEHGTAFVYVMPLSQRRALVEYTLFTTELLTAEQYETALKQYLQANIKSTYTVLNKEEGKIPMTNYRWPESKGRLINIGTAGGQTKPSSGYTFQFIQQQADLLCHQLAKDQQPRPKSYQHTRFHFYDAVLLEVLAKQYSPGEIIFTRLFSKNKLSSVLQFLGNQSTLSDELRIISVLPKWTFLKAALNQVFR